MSSGVKACCFTSSLIGMTPPYLRCAAPGSIASFLVPEISKRGGIEIKIKALKQCWEYRGGRHVPPSASLCAVLRRDARGHAHYPCAAPAGPRCGHLTSAIVPAVEEQ